jgi:hypothetical protein
MADLLEHFLGEPSAEQRSALGGARRAETSPLAGEGDEVLAAAFVAADPEKPLSKSPQSRNA